MIISVGKEGNAIWGQHTEGLQLFSNILFLMLGGGYMDVHYIVLSTVQVIPEERSVP